MLQNATPRTAKQMKSIVILIVLSVTMAFPLSVKVWSRMWYLGRKTKMRSDVVGVGLGLGS